jgi:hypothetical protein
MSKFASIEEAQKAFEAADAENKKLKAAAAKADKETRTVTDKYNDVLKKLKEKVDHGGAFVIRPKDPVEGVFTAKYRDPNNGAEVEKTVKFADGQRNARMKDGELVSSAALMAIAAGETVDAAVLDKFPALKKVTQQQAQDRLTDLVKLNYPGLVEVA